MLDELEHDLESVEVFYQSENTLLRTSCTLYEIDFEMRFFDNKKYLSKSVLLNIINWGEL